MAFVYTTRCKESLTGVSGAAAHPSLTGRVTRRLAADSARNFKSRRYDRRRLNGNRRFGREMVELAERAQAKLAELAAAKQAKDAAAIEASRLEVVRSVNPPVDPFEEVKAKFAAIGAAPARPLKADAKMADDPPVATVQAEAKVQPFPLEPVGFSGRCNRCHVPVYNKVEWVCGGCAELHRQLSRQLERNSIDQAGATKLWSV